MKKLSLIMTFLACMCNTPHANAQLSNILDKISNTVSLITGKSTATDITGTWVLKGSAVEFESDNILMSAGGAAASTTIESKFDEQLAKIGLKAGAVSFTFKSDKTFTINGKKTLQGTYEYGSSNNRIVFSFGNSNLAKVNAKITASTSSLKILFNADKLLGIVTFMANTLNNPTLNTVSELAKSYDGMMVGFCLSK